MTHDDNNPLEERDAEVVSTAAVDDDWRETSDGFAEVDVDLDDETKSLLVEGWLRDNIDPASMSVFNHARTKENEDADATDQFRLAVYEAIMNEAILEAIKAGIKMVEDQEGVDLSDDEPTEFEGDGC